MKIGILTWYFGHNYGAKAHSYALMKIVESLGYSCEMIHYFPKGSLRVQVRSNLNYPDRFKHPVLLTRVLIRCFKFHLARNKYKESPRVSSSEEIERLKYDKVILGSDEILNILHPMHENIYYGVGINTEKFLYAPSSGQTETNTRLEADCVNSLNDCIGLSARDEHTKELIENNIGKSVQITLDPTLLYDFHDVGVKNWKHEKYILIYSFDPLDNYEDRIAEYVTKNNLKVYCLGRYSKKADKNFDTASFDLWVEMFRHAELVITDSFHGTVFSIKNNKPFVICSRPDKVNKIMDLVSELGINNSFYSKEMTIEEYLNKPIDYYTVNKVLEQKKKKSLEYLERCLSD